MEFTEYIASFLRANGYENATNGSMPSEPNRNVTVYASGMRGKKDEEGSRFQVIVRSEPNNDTAIGDSADIIDLLDEYSGILTVDSPWFNRIRLDGGATNIGADENGRLLYSINFRAWYC